MIIMLMQVLWYNKYMRDNTTTYAFIDSQNLYKGVGGDIVNPKTEKVEYEGWELDYRKFRLYLKNNSGFLKHTFLSVTCQVRNLFTRSYKTWGTPWSLSQLYPSVKMESAMLKAMWTQN